MAAVLAGIGLYLSLNRLVKAAIETVGPKVAGVGVSVSAVRILPFSGSGHIKGVEVGNPPGFTQPYALRLKDMRVSIDLKSLRTDKIVVREIYVDGPQVDFETGPKGSNLDRLQRNVQSFASPSSPKSASKSDKKVIIERFDVVNGKATLGTHLIQGKTLAVALPDIHLRGIGKKSGGATIQEAVSQILGSLSAGAAHAAASFGDIGKTIDKSLQSVAGSLKSLFKKRN